jgi:hypothetical protein
VLIKHHKQQTLLMVEGLATRDNEVIKQKQTQTQNRRNRK